MYYINADKINKYDIWRKLLKAEIISVGTELLLGQIVDTNAPFLSRVIAEMGIDLYYRITVGDNPERLKKVLQTALERSDIVFTSGGLGPTQDDITKEIAAEVMGDKMHLDKVAEEHLRKFFATRGITMPESNIKQAMAPLHGVLLLNPNGTAPGAIFEKDGKFMVVLPGPPHEFIPMVNREALPYIAKKIGKTTSIIKSRVLRIAGLGESMVEDMVKAYLSSTNPTVAPYVGKGDVMLRITAKCPTETEAEVLLNEMDAKLSAILGDNIFGRDETTMETAVVKSLITRNLTIATAESCTGGLISSRITDVAGSSAAMLMGVIAYSNDCKIETLRIDPAIIKEHGAVSEQTAKAMAERIRKLSGADIGVSTTGIAGPDGGTPEKPVGLVYIAVSTKKETQVQKHRFLGGREAVKMRTSQTALDMVRRIIERI